jgi:mRNA interferase MazF
MVSTEQPTRGEIWLVSLGAGRRGEPAKTRPAIVLSADELLIGSDDELIVVVPLSSSRAPSKLRPSVSPAEGVETESAAIVRAIRAVAGRRLLRRVGKARPQTLLAVEDAAAVILGLDAGR